MYSPGGGKFAGQLDELCGDWNYIPLDEIMDLIKKSEANDIRDAITKDWIFHHLLSFFVEEDPLEIEIVETLLEICPEAASIPVRGGDFFADANTPIYPLLTACYNCNSQNRVIELLLEKSTQGLDQMVLLNDGIIEWCGDVKVAGTPLHYYLYWGKGHIDIVTRLVVAFPGAMTMKDTTVVFGLTPLHTILWAPSHPDLEVVKFLVQSNPSILRERDTVGQFPIHLALGNQYITVEIIEFLLDSNLDNLWEMRDWDGFLPFHQLLRNSHTIHRIEEATAIAILQLCLRSAPNTFFQEIDSSGRMPIHYAASSGYGAAFCKQLVELAPGCERIPGAFGRLPLFGASHFDTVKYLVGLYPESIYLTHERMTPFVHALRKLTGPYRNDIIRYFLELDPSFASTAVMISRPSGRTENMLPLQAECIKWMGAELWKRPEVVKTLFDYYPNAILVTDSEGKQPLELAKDAMSNGRRYEKDIDKKVIAFLETQYPFAVNADSSNELHRTDENGLLLLHRALLKRDISLGTIKLIVNGTSRVSATRGPNPLHLACMNCDVDVIQYLLSVYGSLVNDVDEEGSNILHAACRGGNWKAVTYLLEHHAPLVSETNNMNLLPVHVMCDKSGKKDIYGIKGPLLKSKEYLDAIWQLLLAYPTVVSSAVAKSD